MERSAAAVLRAIRVLDAISEGTGRLVAWLIFPMMLSLVYEVLARYAFRSPTLWAYDLTFMLYGTFFMLGAAYTLRRKAHIRTDFLYAKWSVRQQGAVDAALYLVFYFPALAIFLWVGWDYAAVSWARHERIVTSPWMPPVYPFKTVIPVTAALLLLQGVSEFLKSLHAARRGEWL